MLFVVVVAFNFSFGVFLLLGDIIFIFEENQEISPHLQINE